VSISPQSTDSLLQRRPVAARRWGFVNRVAVLLDRAGISPNAISIAGVLACGLAGGLFAITPRLADQSPMTLAVIWAAAGLLVLLRGLCNVLDGMVAVARGSASRLGELWNELPDRLSDAAMLIGLGYALGGSPVLGWCAALAAVLTAYVRAQCRALGAPQDFGGPMAKPTRLTLVALCGLVMALLPPWLTLGWAEHWPVEFLSPGVGPDPGAGLPAALLLLILVGSLLTAAARVRRAAAFLRRETPPGDSE